MAKKSVMVSLDSELHRAARAQSLNVSKIANDALKAALGERSSIKQRLAALRLEAEALQAILGDPGRLAEDIVRAYPNIYDLINSGRVHLKDWLVIDTIRATFGDPMSEAIYEAIPLLLDRAELRKDTDSQMKLIEEATPDEIGVR